MNKQKTIEQQLLDARCLLAAKASAVRHRVHVIKSSLRDHGFRKGGLTAEQIVRMLKEAEAILDEIID